MITARRVFSAAREEGWVLPLFEGCGLRFSQSEKSDSCPTAKPPSDAEHRFLPLPEAALCFISVGTEMKGKTLQERFLRVHTALNPFSHKKSPQKEGISKTLYILR
jgi:hypothetical protein